MNVAVILAGGIGNRVGAGKPKQFVSVFGKPLIVYTIEKFQSHNDINIIEVVCVKSHMQEMKRLIKEYNLDKVQLVIEGGIDFQHSVINGINGLKKICDSEDVILIHYGASPFIEADIISDSIRVCKEKGNCVSATPIYLLTGSNDGNSSKHWVDRDSIMCLNSPQAFLYGNVCSLYDEAIKTGVVDSVEPHTTSLMYKMGKEIYFSMGNQTNIKITTREDIELFKGYVLLKKMYDSEE